MEDVLVNEGHSVVGEVNTDALADTFECIPEESSGGTADGIVGKPKFFKVWSVSERPRAYGGYGVRA